MRENKFIAYFLAIRNKILPIALTSLILVLASTMPALESYANGEDVVYTPPVPMTKPDAAIAKLEDVKVELLYTGKIQVDLCFSQPTNPPKSFKIESPTRIILDFLDVEQALAQPSQKIDVGFLDSYEVVDVANRTRVILNLKEDVQFEVRVSGNHVYVILTSESYVQKNYNTKVFAQNVCPNNQCENIAHEILGIDFRRDVDGGGRVVVTLSDANMGINVNQMQKDVIVDFIDTVVPQRLQRRLDVIDFATPVNFIELKAKGGNGQMVVTGNGAFKQVSYQVNNQFIVDISPDKEANVLGKAEEVRYTGERLSLNFQDIPVRAVLQLLAEFTGINIVASDSVQGNMTVRLNNVPWDEALAIIMKTQGLAQRKVGNIIMIAPAEEVAAKEKQELESRKEVKGLEPLITEIISLNFANGKAIAELLKSQAGTLLSARGTVSVDERTNSILVQDTEEILANLHSLITQLDIPVKQVLIESRIVNVDTNFEKDIGIQWGITKPSHVSGTLEGANAIDQNVINGVNPLLDVDPLSRLNVNLPATPVTGVPGTFGVAVAKLGRGFLLDLEISALESEGAGELISSPRLVTANQKEAYIEKGEEIPYQEQTSSGATSVQFKKAVLGLRVTPLITPDGKIILTLKINQDRRSAQPEVLGVPAIDTRQIETQVLVDNGETIVLGGIYEEDKQHKVTRIPFLGTLPVIGNLFKTTEDINNRTELLIFITPKIIQQSSLE